MGFPGATGRKTLRNLRKTVRYPRKNPKKTPRKRFETLNKIDQEGGYLTCGIAGGTSGLVAGGHLKLKDMEDLESSSFSFFFFVPHFLKIGFIGLFF